MMMVSSAHHIGFSVLPALVRLAVISSQQEALENRLQN